ncbi:MULTISPECIES: hypothetical protein [Achromobacter]|uniref:Uncharacterized protein n=1 Tax=Achromobacter denitrificans TaxID=32002 RepID=A0A6N0JHP1_ACHDE|nr:MULTISPECIES: hypothetical protein [Achromobacter]MDF3859039.1 hypothetical protein [Achromobacter denitrificans]QKQ46604.1 hypothetical protein FOC81_07815 [Achromobacter denitrificans]
MKPYVQISLRTKIETNGWDIGGQLIESLYLNDGLLAPECVSHNPDKVTELLEGKHHAEQFWAKKISIRVNGSLSDHFDYFAWKRKGSVKSTGYVSHTMRDIRNRIVPGGVHLNSVYSDKVDWYHLFKVWCEIFPPQLAMLHYFTGPELQPHMVNDSFQIGSFNAALRPDVPNAGWGMFYGNEFSDRVDADRIASAGFPIEKIGDGYLVRVTNDIQDIVADFQLFAQRRVELKSLFPEGFFLV